ncbi:MAG: uracil-DNA glycosylase [Gemmatimonadales bacterium]
MRVNECIRCEAFPCADVRHESYVVPGVEVQPRKVAIAMVAEAAPADPGDYYYAKGKPLFQETTVQAFRDAGADVSSVGDILNMGVYLTTAVKCGKTGYGIKAGTIKECSKLLERELALFPHLQAVMLMGDVAIKAMNYISKRAGAGRVIPAGSTYKLRCRCYLYRGIQVYPSYLQAGPSFFIEKSKRKMIAEDIRNALGLLGQ